MDAIDVAANDGVEPDAAFIAYFHLSYYGCIGRYETVFAELWVFSFYW
jgi:hypothetical protein